MLNIYEERRIKTANQIVKMSSSYNFMTTYFYLKSKGARETGRQT